MSVTKSQRSDELAEYFSGQAGSPYFTHESTGRHALSEEGRQVGYSQKI
jgi:hypothetical protein